MKVTAKISDYTYLVEMSVEEMNKITGENRSTRGGYNDIIYKINETFNPIKHFDYLKGIFEKKKELFSTARNLRAMADMIESMKVPEYEEDAKSEVKGDL